MVAQKLDTSSVIVNRLSAAMLSSTYKPGSGPGMVSPLMYQTWAMGSPKLLFTTLTVKGAQPSRLSNAKSLTGGVVITNCCCVVSWQPPPLALIIVTVKVPGLP